MMYPIHFVSRNEEVMFKRNGRTYRYVWQSTKSQGFAYIYNEAREEIYGPYRSTQEGREVYADYFEMNSKKLKHA